MSRHAPIALRVLLVLGALAVLGRPGAASAQVTDPCFFSDPTRWDPGPGWEVIGNCRSNFPDGFVFDAGGTLFNASFEVDSLDTTAGLPGIWRRVLTAPRIQDLLPLSTPDSLVGGIGPTYRTVDRHATWPAIAQQTASVLHQIPRGARHAGRLFANSSNAGPMRISDDLGVTWRPPAAAPPAPSEFSHCATASYPAEDGPWGAGLPGRTLLGECDRGIAASDDGGDTLYPTDLWIPGRLIAEMAVLARPAAEGGGLRALAIGEINGGGSGCVRAWTSDDGGLSWTQSALLCEPCVHVGCPAVKALLPLAHQTIGYATPRGAALAWPATTWETSDALAVLGRGGVFRTRDGGRTWAREPGPVGQVPLEVEVSDLIDSATLSPEGRLYVGVGRLGVEAAWAVRSDQGLAVAAAPAVTPAGAPLSVAVRPNPSRGGAVSVSVAVPVASARLRVIVVDAQGREVAVLHDGAASGGLSLSVETGGWASGAYVVRAESGGAVGTARLVVSR